jgi:hypothetical protein
MKIATWNIERLKHATKLVRMRMEIEKQDADVLVLTEADTRLQLPSYPFRVETESLEAPFYRETERRVIIQLLDTLELCGIETSVLLAPTVKCGRTDALGTAHLIGRLPVLILPEYSHYLSGTEFALSHCSTVYG